MSSILIQAAGASGIKIASGKTSPDAWMSHKEGTVTGVYVEVDTSAAHFTTTPQYFTSLGGEAAHWGAVGATSIYFPSPTSFRVYLPNVTLPAVKARKWYINWLGVEMP